MHGTSHWSKSNDFSNGRNSDDRHVPILFHTFAWDGGTLVVTTTSVNWPHFDTVGIPLSEAVEILERFTSSEDGSRLDYGMTVTDPATFTEPVSLEKYWLWLPDIEVGRYECTVEG